MSSSNPFDDRSTATMRSTSSSRYPRPSYHHSYPPRDAASNSEPAIWAARHVEWPIPRALSVQNFAKLQKASKQSGQALGIITTTTTTSTQPDAPSNTTTAATDGKASGGSAEEGSAGWTGYIMSRVMPSSVSDASKSAPDASSSDVDPNDRNATRPLLPPRQGCVASANGWIVAVLECHTTSSLPGVLLRLLSRWNVRRGGSSSNDQWLALPPPVNGNGKILHVFVDPTASHTVLSAANGEAYYIHSRQAQQTHKLHGFGPGVDGSPPSSKELTGIPATAIPQGHQSEAAIQSALTVGTHVTAIAWDKERGTEGTSKRILLGTAGGEIYEYQLDAQPSGTGSSGATSSGSGNQDDKKAKLQLLHRLYNAESSSADPSEVGASVTGLYFERLRTGLLVLAATSGRHKRTRFYTFYSPHNSSFRMVMADQQHASLTELPGSIEFADLKLCNDYFGLLTATGIYYGKIDRSLSSSSSQKSSKSSGSKLSSGSNMIVDSGILPYDSGSGGAIQLHNTNTVPVSLAITPHHLITWSSSSDANAAANEVCFVNRVAQKVIQRERVDLMGGAQSMPSAFLQGEDQVGELMMDIRRPDQVWLRKGRSLVHISPTTSQEDRDVWKFTLQKALDMTIKNSSSPQAAASPKESLWATQQSATSLRNFAAASLTDDEKAQEALFEEAKTLCSTSAQKAVVTAIRAEYHLSQGRAELAAKFFAQSPPSLHPFADTAIRLALPKLGIDNHEEGAYKAHSSLESSNLALIGYLSDRMQQQTSRARSSADGNQDIMTSTMIGAWLTELYLNERTGGGDPKTREAQRVMLAHFLNSNVKNMDAKTIMKILTSHDVGATECAIYAATSGDIATAVNAALSVGSGSTRGAQEALEILNEAPFELAESLYYKHAPTLLAKAPALAGDSFLRRYGQGLSPLRLLPSLMHYEQKRMERARLQRAMEESRSITGPLGGGGVDESKDGSPFEQQQQSSSFVEDASVVTLYLEGVIQRGCRSSAVYNYLVSMYAKLSDEEPLLAFLSAHVPTNGNGAALDTARKAVLTGNTARLNFANDFESTSGSPLDMTYALRTVLKTGRHFRSAIKLYMGFGMRQQAVELALKVDPTLARDLAQGSVDLEERKRLWLMIAKYAASDSTAASRGGRAGMDVVSRVVAVLKDCDDVLSIEDVLPFLPDFAQIDQIKDEICEALTSYSSKIDGFLMEMKECDEICDNLRGEIGRLRNHRMRMRADARCGYTGKPVLSAGEPFYVFPSGYVFLASALKAEVLPCLNQKQRERVDELEQLLVQQPASARRDDWQIELDGLIAAECPLTGTVLVESIDRGFDNCAEIDESSYLRPDAAASKRVDV